MKKYGSGLFSIVERECCVGGSGEKKVMNDVSKLLMFVT